MARKPPGEISYGGPKGRTVRQYLSDNNYATIDILHVTIHDTCVTIEG